jgi:hypothetical protein
MRDAQVVVAVATVVAVVVAAVVGGVKITMALSVGERSLWLVYHMDSSCCSCR